MKRRIISVLMALLLLLPAAFAHADNAPVTITSEDVRGKVGETVTATLNITVEPPKVGQTMDSLQFVLEYDSAALEFVDIQEVSGDSISILGAQFTCNVATKAGSVAFTAAASAGCSGSGLLMHVRFKILSAVSTILVLKKVSYSFVTTNSGSQRGYTGGTINLGRVTGESAPTTVAPPSVSPGDSPEPTAPATEQPRYPVSEVTLAPGVSPSPEPEEQSGSDTLAYIVFGLFIVVAILICVVLTLMIVRRGKNARNQALLGDDEEEMESIEYEDEGMDEEPYDEEPYDEEPYEEAPPKPKKKKRPPVEEDEDDEPPIQIVRRIKK